jgi:hypothetical protein
MSFLAAADEFRSIPRARRAPVFDTANAVGDRASRPLATMPTGARNRSKWEHLNALFLDLKEARRSGAAAALPLEVSDEGVHLFRESPTRRWGMVGMVPRRLAIS